jgi:hypothetical protein
VHHRGMPSAFLTLTADEVSPTRWDEVDDLEEFLEKFGRGLEWHDAPVENARLFHLRVTEFLDRFVLGDTESSSLLGNVPHYLIRYEVQHRGSLHAHIVLWLSDADRERLASEICACVPAAYDAAAEQFIPPSDPSARRLYEFVVSKQMHECRAHGCLEHGRCKYMYPHPPQPLREAQFDPHSMRYMYYRPGHEHRNVIPYHPTLLLLWGAHMNLQLVTNTAWSKYLLKYSLKCEPHGRLNLDAQAARDLGMENMTDTQVSAAF